MQAPATPGGLPAGEAHGRTCPSCGAENGALAGFCWRCYTSFAGGRPSSGSSFPPPPGPFPSAPVEARSSGPFGAVATLLAVALAIGAVVWFAFGRGGAPSFPDEVAGSPRLEAPELEQALDLARAQAGAEIDFEFDMAFYGPSTAAPRLALMWARGDQLGSADGAFDALASGLTGLPAGAEAFQRFERDGVTFVCATGADLGVPAPPMALCMWPQGDTYWMLFDMQPGGGVQATADLSATVNAAVA